MAFKADAIVARLDYNEDIVAFVMNAVNYYLMSLGLKVEKEVTHEEYRDNSSSKEISKYIRVGRAKLEENKKEVDKLMKVGTARYEFFEQFSSARYAFVSISKMDEYCIIWANFHSKLEAVVPQLKEACFNIAEVISRGTRNEIMSLHATSLSRTDDAFAVFVSGKARHTLSGKGALTDVKNQYNIDINRVMDNIDRNIAIFYAPLDYAEVSTEITSAKKRYTELKAKAEEVEVKNKEEGTNMLKAFEKENTHIMRQLEYNLEVVVNNLRADPIGVLRFIKIDKYEQPTEETVPEDERLFGEEIRKMSK